MESFICDRLDFLIKCSRGVDEDTETVTFDVITLYTSVPHEFGFEGLDYFSTTCQKDFHPRSKKEFVLESVNFIRTIF